MKKLLMLFLSLFISPVFGSGIASNTASAPCTNNTLETYSGNSNLQADWQPNTINLRWYNENEKLTVQQSAQTCTYDGTLTVPQTPPTRTGYTFAGWEVKYAIPSEYTELEYLESTNRTAYINTGIQFNSGNTYKITFSKGGYENTIMGVSLVASYSEKGIFELTYCGTNTCVYSSESNGATPSGFGAKLGIQHTMQYQQSTKTLLFDNVNKWRNDWITNIEIPKNMVLFLANRGTYVSGSRTEYLRIYSYEVWNSGDELIQNFIPARRDSDGVLGMYDSITGTFFTNAGTGTFVAGPAVQ